MTILISGGIFPILLTRGFTYPVLLVLSALLGKVKYGINAVQISSFNIKKLIWKVNYVHCTVYTVYQCNNSITI